MKHKKFNPLALIASLVLLLSSYSMAEAGPVIEAKANEAIKQFYKDVKGGEKFLASVKGFLIFPSITKGGFIIGGEYGEGVLRINGESKGYYSMASGSLGFQLGLQQNSYLIAFVSEPALENFMKSNGWESGVDGAVTVAKWGAGKNIGSISFENPIYVFVYNGKGLMYNINVKGTKFTKIDR